MDLVIKQSISQQESVTAELVDKLYQLTKPDTITGQPAANAVLVGRLEALAAYEDAVNFLNAQFSSAQDNGSDLRVSVLNNNYYIRFADSAVEEVLRLSMGKDEGEGITVAEAANTFANYFQNNYLIESFDELKYFKTGNYIFNGCTNLESVDITDKYGRFNNCTNLVNWYGGRKPDGYLYLGNPLSAAAYCPGLTELEIGEEAPDLWNGQFEGSKNIAILRCKPAANYQFGYPAFRLAPVKNVYIENMDNWLTCRTYGSGMMDSNTKIFYNDQLVTSVEVPQTITQIGGCFAEYRHLTSVQFHSDITSIATGTFNNCTNLVIQDLNLPNLTTLGNYAFYGTKVQAISDLGSVTNIPEYCFKNCSQLTTIDQGVLDKITVLNREAFNSCTNLGSVKLSDDTISSVLRLPNLTSIALDSVRYTKFTEIADLGSITEVKGFSEMYSLTNVVLPQTCTAVGDSAFVSDAALTTIDLSNITRIGNSAFNGCNNLTYFHGVGSTAGELNLSNVTSIGDRAFNGCRGLTSVFIGSSLISTGVAAFNGCVNLTAVNITDLDAWWGIAFGNNSNYGNYYANPLYYAHHLYLNGVEVKDVVVPNNVTSIGKAVFAGGSLTSITIHNSVTSIGRSAFENCRDLPTVTIPNSMTLIQAYAFSDCTGLTSIIINAITPPTLEAAAAFQNTNNCPIYVPAGSVEAYKSASGWSSLASRIQAIPTT